MSDLNLYSTVPLRRVVNAVAIDSYEELSKVEERYSHWAVRVLRKLNRQTIKANKKRVAINVSLSTKTAALPVDFYENIFIGFINDQGQKVAIPTDPEIYGEYEQAEESCCAKCGQALAVCEAMEVVVTTRAITPVIDCDCYYSYGYYYYTAGTPYYDANETVCGPIGGGFEAIDYTETITKRMLPNGDYIEDKTFPIYDKQSCTVRMEKSRRLVQTFELNDCGCVAATAANAAAMCGCNSDIFNLYFNSNYNECDSEVGVKIFMEQGIMQFSGDIDFTKVYMEYYGDLPRKNGDFVIPEMAFEAIVAGVHLKRMEHKKGTSEAAIFRAKNTFKSERKDMMQLLPNRLTIYDILDAATQAPTP